MNLDTYPQRIVKEFKGYALEIDQIRNDLRLKIVTDE